MLFEQSLPLLEYLYWNLQELTLLSAFLLSRGEASSQLYCVSLIDTKSGWLYQQASTRSVVVIMQALAAGVSWSGEAFLYCREAQSTSKSILRVLLGGVKDSGVLVLLDVDGIVQCDTCVRIRISCWV
jgi:hypothetical protein